MAALRALVQLAVERGVAGHSAFVGWVVFLVQSLRTANCFAVVLQTVLFAITDEFTCEDLILLAAWNF